MGHNSELHLGGPVWVGWVGAGGGGLGSYIVRCVTFPLELVALFLGRSLSPEYMVIRLTADGSFSVICISCTNIR
jgi:hypothetical protein